MESWSTQRLAVGTRILPISAFSDFTVSRCSSDILGGSWRVKPKCKKKYIHFIKACQFTHNYDVRCPASKCVKVWKWTKVKKTLGVARRRHSWNRITRNSHKPDREGSLKSGYDRYSCRASRRRKQKGGGSEEGTVEVSVRNASMLEDNPRAGPVRFKSNQSTRINYPPPPPSRSFPPPTIRFTLAHGGKGGCCVCARKGLTSCYAFSPIHTHPAPHLLRWKRTNKNQAIKGFSLSLNKLNADFCFKWRPPFVRRGTGFFIVVLSLVLRTTLSGERTGNRAISR